MTVTFNMGGQTPSEEDLDSLFLKEAVLHDMYVFASQEALCCIQSSVFNPNKEALNQQILDYFAKGTNTSSEDDEIVLVSSTT